MTITTAHKLLNTGLWDKFCALRGYSPWYFYEGLLDGDEPITLSSEELAALTGLGEPAQAVPSPITTIEELYAQTDWALLREQKNLLTRISGDLLTSDDYELLQGLLSFIDAVQDLAQDHYGQTVFAEKD